MRLKNERDVGVIDSYKLSERLREEGMHVE